MEFTSTKNLLDYYATQAYPPLPWGIRAAFIKGRNTVLQVFEWNGTDWSEIEQSSLDDNWIGLVFRLV